jgi:Leucine-rich repeat (LRR) protein
MRGGKLGMLGLVVALFLSLMPIAGAQVADDSGESLEQQAFTDTANSVFRGAIDQLAALGITRGCNPPANTRYCPDDPVTRGQMAIFIVRAYNLPPAGADYFFDDNGKVYEDAVNRLRQAGLTQGCGPGQYCGDETISRGEMAAFLSRAENLPDSNTDHFVDDNTSIFERGINKVADAGITLGCNPPANTNFCPNDNVTRGQMAAFIIRALTGGVTPPGPPGPPPPPPGPPPGPFCTQVSGITKGDCEALVKLYNATGGGAWTNKGSWAVSKTPCTWPGVTCTGNRVTRLILSPVEAPFVGNLSGSIPGSLGALTMLQEIDLASNELLGSIPPQLSQLSNLQGLDLSGNTLSGQIPGQLGALTNLTIELDLHSNLLTGPIPTTFGSLDSLLILDLGANNLSGDLSVLGGMSSLNVIDLRENAFSGVVPGEIGNLLNLTRLDLSANLPGFQSIGSGFGDAINLTDVDLSNNRLNGAISTEFLSLTALTELDLSFNQLDGVIPDGITSLIGLEALDLSVNTINDPEVPAFQVLPLEELGVVPNTCIGTSVLATFNFIASLNPGFAATPTWTNCGLPIPTAPPAEPPAGG